MWQITQNLIACIPFLLSYFLSLDEGREILPKIREIFHSTDSNMFPESKNIHSQIILFINVILKQSTHVLECICINGRDICTNTRYITTNASHTCTHFR